MAAGKMQNVALRIANMNMENTRIGQSLVWSLTEAAEYIGIEAPELLMQSMDGIAPSYAVNQINYNIEYLQNEIRNYKKSLKGNR